jgi:hypothetical protein
MRETIQRLNAYGEQAASTSPALHSIVRSLICYPLILVVVHFTAGKSTPEPYTQGSFTAALGYADA